MNTTDTAALSPCPFCGSDLNPLRGYFTHAAKGCYLGGLRISEHAANDIAAWNRRATTPQTDGATADEILGQVPCGWIRGVESYVPGERSEWNVDFSWGDDQPDDDHRWEPVYRSPVMRARIAQTDGATVAVELSGVDEVLSEGEGFWRECSGCYETEDGHPVGHYPYSEVLRCYLGNGCAECGGLGAIWDNTDYEAMAHDFERALAATHAPAMAETQVPQFDAKHVSLKQRGQNIILTLELNGVEPAPRYKVIPVNPGVVRRAAASGGEQG
jgi:hypothetical protein